MSGKIYTRVQERQQRAARRAQINAQMSYRPVEGLGLADNVRMDIMRQEADRQLRQWAAREFGGGMACHCIGPQHGQPRCPCDMRNVTVRGGRYVRGEADLGAAPEQKRDTFKWGKS